LIVEVSWGLMRKVLRSLEGVIKVAEGIRRNFGGSFEA
jgi:hypothetical protein